MTGNGAAQVASESAAPDARDLDALECLDRKRRFVRDHYDRIADRREKWVKRNRYYYRSLIGFLQFVVEPGRSVLQVRGDTGHLLAGMSPSVGIGVDVSPKLVELSRRLHPQYEFVVMDPEELDLPGRTFDYVLVNSVNDIVDIGASFVRLRDVTTDSSRVLVLGYNYLWRPLVRLAEAVGLKVKQPAPNWLSERDIENLLDLAGFEVIRTYGLFLFPLYIPLLSELLNRVVARLPLFRRLTFLYLVVARKLSARSRADASVSVIIPCKDEEGNIEPAVRRVPDMGSHTELLFCDDRSEDGTAAEVRRMQEMFPEKDIKLVEGPGISKAMNVWTGFDAARGDVLMILDADLTVIPEELPYFFQAIADGRGEFINGSRMVYPMQKDAMRSFNIFGNTCFSWAFTFLLGQRIKDTLCGTKVLWRSDYERLKRFGGTWGIDDRWGDYELLFGATRQHLKIVDLPVHYMERVRGETKMKKRLKNAMVMLRMCWGALIHLKFV